MLTPTSTFPKLFTTFSRMDATVVGYFNDAYYGCLEGVDKVSPVRWNANGEYLQSDGKTARGSARNLDRRESQNHAMWWNLGWEQREMVRCILKKGAFRLSSIRLLHEYLGWTMSEAKDLFEDISPDA